MLTPTDHKFFNVAKAAALTSKHHKTKIGAVLVHKKDILSVGVNKQKTHPKQKQYNKHRQFEDPSICGHNIHAELDAILKSRHIPKGTKVYVYRVMKDNKTLGMCRPCNACSKALKECGVTEWYYTTTFGFAYEQICS